MSNYQWDQEEFEDLVARSLIALYETDINKKCNKVFKFLRVNEKDLIEVKQYGCYFPPDDRDIEATSVDLVNDFLPSQACYATSVDNRNESNKDYISSSEYLRIAYLKKINEFPGAVVCKPGIAKYKLIYFSATNKEKIWLQKCFIAIDKYGCILDTYIRDKNDNGKLVPLALGTIINASELGINESLYFKNKHGHIYSDVLAASAAINFSLDSRFIWNVVAKEGIAKAKFGVYEDQIKSLFYSRELPMTGSGRKRSILHWVTAHRRRIKEGIDIDINKHLRGCNEFVFNGTKFQITNPIKKIEVKNVY